MSPKVISSVAVVSFSLMTGTTPHVEQPPQRLARVQVVGARGHVEGGQQHLRGADALRGEPLLVDAEEVPWPTAEAACSSSIAAGRAGSPISRIPRAIAPEVTSTTALAVGSQLGDLAADRVEHVVAHLAVVVGDDRGAELDDEVMGAQV